MKGLFRIFLAVGFSFVFVSNLWADRDEYNYGPACQWMRLQGEIQAPPDGTSQGPILLSVYYRLDGQKKPSALLINYPLQDGRFSFVLSGIQLRIQGTIFVPPMFFFAKEIEFTYFATAGRGTWSSPQGKLLYSPEKVKKNGQVLCQTRLTLPPIVLNKR